MSFDPLHELDDEYAAYLSAGEWSKYGQAEKEPGLPSKDLPPHDAEARVAVAPGVEERVTAGSSVPMFFILPDSVDRQHAETLALDSLDERDQSMEAEIDPLLQPEVVTLTVVQTEETEEIDCDSLDSPGSHDSLDQRRAAEPPPAVAAEFAWASAFLEREYGEEELSGSRINDRPPSNTSSMDDRLEIDSESSIEAALGRTVVNELAFDNLESITLSALRAEREMLSAELAGLRTEISLHRDALRDMIEIRKQLAAANAYAVSPLPSIPHTGAPAGSADDESEDNEPTAADIRQWLPTVRALMGPEDRSIEFAVEQSEGRSDFSSARSPKLLPMTARIVDRTEGGFEERSPHELVGVQNKMNDGVDCKPEQRTSRMNATDLPGVRVRLRKSAEWTMPVRANGVLLATAFFVFVGGPLTWLSMENVRLGLASAEVRDAIAHRPINLKLLESAIDPSRDSPLARFDARHEYVRARAIDLLAGRKSAGEILTARRTVDPAAFRRVERAIERSPANVWYRLSLAKLADRAQDESAPRQWATVESFTPTDPLFWETLGDSYRMNRRPADAVRAFQLAAGSKPELTRRLLSLLAEIRVDVTESLTIVPPSPIAVLAAVQFLRNDEGRRDWQTHASRLVEKMPTNLNEMNVEELASAGEVWTLVQQPAEGAAAFEAALGRQPRRNDVRLQLARIRYEQGSFADADRHAESIVRTDPAGPFGDEARTLRTKIELVHSGRRTGRPGETQSAQ